MSICKQTRCSTTPCLCIKRRNSPFCRFPLHPAVLRLLPSLPAAALYPVILRSLCPQPHSARSPFTRFVRCCPLPGHPSPALSAIAFSRFPYACSVRCRLPPVTLSPFRPLSPSAGHPLPASASCPLPPVVIKFSAINVVSREGHLKKAAFHWAGRSNGVDGKSNAGIPAFLKHSEVLNSRVWCVNPWGDASRKRSWRFLPALRATGKGSFVCGSG